MIWIVIPILALLIPITAIVLNSTIGKAIAEVIREKNRISSTDAPGLKSLEQRLLLLENKIDKLEEDNRFFQKLLQDKS